MKKLLEQFYNENKPLLDITALLLVATGLMLNISTTDGLAGQSINQIKFFLLLATGFFFSYLLFVAYIFFINPLMENTKNDTTGKLLVKKINITLFFFLIGGLFVINLIIYLLSSYFKEFLFIIITLICYVILWLLMPIAPINSSWRAYMYASFMFILWIEIPITTYIILFFKIPLASPLFLMVVITDILLAIILFILIAIFSKKNKI